MIKNYLKVAWRNLVRNKAHTFINIAGLSIGLACSLLILLWVQNELGIDAFHKNVPNLFSVYDRFYSGHKPTATYNTSGPLAAELKRNIPDIEYATGFGFNDQHVFRVGGKVLKLEGNSADADFFKMFSYKLLQGNAATALSTPAALAVSKKMAEDFFGSAQNAIGKTIRYDNKRDFTISAVFENLSANSSQKFDFLTNWDAFYQENPWAREMGNLGPGTFIQLRADANPQAVEAKLVHYLDKFNTTPRNSESATLGMQRFDKVYLHSNFVNGQLEGGRIGYVNLFSIVAVFILLIACINFMNLSTARSVKRAREIGVRKVVGALRSSLIQQFISESLLTTALAVIISLLLVILLLPVFNQITQKQIELPFGEPMFWLKLVALTLITGIISGSYPALFLSSFNPVKVLKGALKLNSGTTFFRKGLVVFQFVLAVVLIIGTLIVSRQVNYIQSINLGYDKENLVYVPLEGDLSTRFDVFKNEALKMRGIQSITRTSKDLTNIQTGDYSANWDGIDPNLDLLFNYVYAGYDFVGTMKLNLVKGRSFSREFPSDTAGFLINETMSKIMGFADPIGKRLRFRHQEGKIIGVLKDFHFNSLHEQIGPLIVPFDQRPSYGTALIRTQPGQTKQALTSLATLYKQLNPNFQFSYTFSDEAYNKLYNDEQIISKLSDAFAFLAIFISCMGLLGLAMFTTGQRVKEIGVRKVLGANVASLFVLLSSEFLQLVLISLAIGSPIAWFAMNKWLQGFAYHTPLQWWMFVLSGGLILLIALVTVSFQAIKAALINPIKSLRSE
ncbi:MAG TPA: ABC transporter permease [Mucilaginibacter sp.]|jgi:ABC-type antimicrobial peptide transport system permease subunit